MITIPLPQILPYRDPEDAAIRGKSVAGYGHIALSRLPWHLHEEMTEGDCMGVKASSTRRVLTFEEEVGAERPMRLYAKRNIARTWGKALTHRLQGSKSRREWGCGWTLIQRGILTGRPVLFAERRRGGLIWENYLITEAIRADRSLWDHLRLTVEERGEDPTPVLGPLARFVQEIHGVGFYHDDLSAEHIWIANDTEGMRFGLIDLDACRFSHALSPRQRLMNLFQILRSVPRRFLSADQREVFLAAFHGERWSAVRDRVFADLSAMEAKKGARSVLG
ncbi:hypothetical protein JXA47_05440 [Candidatus Sumerlaeota bacterium]|nr:hypothetical protein [Candidatus Sumerlaeota bacterium]